MARLQSSTSTLHTLLKRKNTWGWQQWAVLGGVIGGLVVIIIIGVYITCYRNRRVKQHKRKLRQSQGMQRGKYAKIDDEETLIGGEDGHRSSKDDIEMIESRRNSSVSRSVQAQRDHDLEAQHSDSDSKPLIDGANTRHDYREEPAIIAPRPIARPMPLENLTHKIASSQPPVYDHYLENVPSRYSTPDSVLSRATSMLQGRLDQSERGRRALSVAEQYREDRRSLSVAEQHRGDRRSLSVGR